MQVHTNEEWCRVFLYGCGGSGGCDGCCAVPEWPAIGSFSKVGCRWWFRNARAMIGATISGQYRATARQLHIVRTQFPPSISLEFRLTPPESAYYRVTLYYASRLIYTLTFGYPFQYRHFPNKIFFNEGYRCFILKSTTIFKKTSN